MFSSEQKSAGQQRLWLITSLIVLLIVSAWRLFVGADWLANTVLAFTLSGVGLLLWFEWRKLRRVRQAYNMAMLAAHDGFWEWNPITKELRTGTRLLEILGYQHDFLPDTHAWLRLVNSDDISLYTMRYRNILKIILNIFIVNIASVQVMETTSGLPRAVLPSVIVTDAPTRWSALLLTLPNGEIIRKPWSFWPSTMT